MRDGQEPGRPWFWKGAFARAEPETTPIADPKRGNRGSNGLGPRSGCPAGMGRCSLSPVHRTAGLRSTSPEVYGSKGKSQIHSICDFDSFLQCAGPRNRSSPGYELRS